jgi:hypothetical protein
MFDLIEKISFWSATGVSFWNHRSPAEGAFDVTGIPLKVSATIRPNGDHA